MHMHAMLFVIIVSHCELIIYHVMYVSSSFLLKILLMLLGFYF